MHHRPERYSFRRIVLPSGRSIEVVRFYLTDADVQGLHICPQCDSRLVQPVDRAEAPQGLSALVLQCPNCFWLDEGVFDQDQVDALEENLDDGLADMLCDLQRLTETNMAEDIELFAAALHAGLILPEDF
jgi:hypothetical protein